MEYKYNPENYVDYLCECIQMFHDALPEGNLSICLEFGNGCILIPSKRSRNIISPHRKDKKSLIIMGR